MYVKKYMYVLTGMLPAEENYEVEVAGVYTSAKKADEASKRLLESHVYIMTERSKIWINK